MRVDLSTVLAIAAALGSSLIAGTFFAFSAFVMRALRRLPSEQGIAAMQSINIVVINPIFLTAFLGTGLVWAVLMVLALADSRSPRSLWLAAGAVAYLGGCLLVTMVRNVPMNNTLAELSARGPEAARYWPAYVERWTFWNHVRTAGSLAALACCIAAVS